MTITSHDLAAEAAVLGGILLDPNRALPAVRAMLRPEDFFSGAHSTLYRAMTELESAGRPVDVVTIAGHLEAAGQLGRVGGVEVLAELAGKVPTVENIAYHARIVRDRSLVRLVKRAAAQIQTSESDGDELLQELLTACHGLTAGRGAEVLQVGDVVRRILDEAEAAKRGEAAPRGVPTGIRALDSALTFEGWPRGHVSVVAGSTSAGKSALAITGAYGALQAGQRVLCVSLEDEAAAAVARLLSRLSGIDNRQLQRRVVGATEWSALGEAAGELGSLPLAFIEQADSVENLCHQIRAHVLSHGADLVIIDYLQLVRSTRGRSQQEQIDHVFGEVVRLARSLPRTATMVVSQLRRTRGERPSKEDLYHSGALEQWAHTIGILWRPEVPVRGCAAFLLEKQKNGGVCALTLGWDARTCSFGDAGPHEAAAYRKAIEALSTRRPTRAG